MEHGNYHETRQNESPLMNDTIVLNENDLKLLDEGGLQVISALLGNPTTSKQIALKSGLKRARVQYIIDELVRRHLAVVYQEVVEDDRREVYYLINSHDVALKLGSSSPAHIRAAATQFIIDSVRNDLTETLHQPSLFDLGVITLTLSQCRLSHDRAREFAIELQALIQKFKDAEDLHEEQVYALVVGLYPQVNRENDRAADAHAGVE